VLDHGRRGRRGRDRLHEEGAGRFQCRPARAPSRAARPSRRRRQRLHRPASPRRSPRDGAGDPHRDPETVEAEAGRAPRRPGASARDGKAASAASSKTLEAAAREGRNVMEPSIACAKAGVTTGEWGETLAARLRRVPGPDRRRPRRAGDAAIDLAERPASGRGGVAEARPATEIAGRQARPRRPLQRRRADRRPRPRLRHRGGL
jgi:hypothetical protein